MVTVICKRCGRLFNKVGIEDICSSCLQKSYSDSHKISLFLMQNKVESMEDLSQKVGIEIKEIENLAVNGKVELPEEISTLKCERCKKIITNGKLCNACKNNILGQLKQMETEIKENIKQKNIEVKPEMRYFKSTKRF